SEPGTLRSGERLNHYVVRDVVRADPGGGKQDQGRREECFPHPSEYTVRRHGGWPMKRTRNVVIGGMLITLLAALGVGQHLLEQSAQAQAKAGAQAPRFEVDPMWPKPVPNHWVFGNIIGVGVDKNDHVYIIHRGA